MRRFHSLLIILGTVGLVWSFALADDLDPADLPAFASAVKPAEEKKDKDKKDKKEEKKDFPDFKEVITKDFKKVPVPPQVSAPYYTLYYNKKTDQLFAQIPNNKLDKNFMISTSISSAPRIAGWMWGDMVVRWQRRQKKLLLIEPDLRNEGREGKELSEAVRRTYTDRILKAIDIKTLSGSDPVIDLGALFKNDLAKIGRVFGGTLDSSLAKWIKYKCFGNNLVITVESPLSGGKGRFRSATEGTLIAVNYNISTMPETGYKPRVGDDRVGFFNTVRRDWGKDYKAKTLFNRYINRWHLEKQDPSLKMSPVKHPVVFYIEKTVPVRFRNAVKEGILEWNRAYERCGFIDAMQVIQQTDYNEYKDYDPENVDYNFFRWATMGNGLARGPSRANPLTGQIYDADIIFDDFWVRYPIETHATFTPNSMSETISDPKLQAFFKAHPQFDIVSRQQRLLPDYGEELTLTGELGVNYNFLNERYSRHLCDYGADLRNELSFSYAVLEAQGYPEIPEKFVQQVVKEVVMHEVGHTLGLFHNFKASSWLGVDEMLNKTDLNRPISGSVMDYNAFMFHPDKEKQGDYAMVTLGPYDMWAIEYGYRSVEEPYKSEEEMLKAIVDRVAENGLAYANDYDAGIFDPDPLVNRRDMGSDVLEFAEYRIELVKQLQQDMADWAVDDGESYSRLRRRFNRLLYEIGMSALYAGRYVGGQYFHRYHKGDPDSTAPFVMVSADKQREAMKFLAEHVFAEDAFQFDPELLNKLAPGRWAHWGSDDYDSWIEYNLHDRIEMIMRWALLPVFNPFTITRLHDMPLRYKADEEVYTLAEHIRSLTGIVWAELDKPASETYTDRSPYINSFRRGLQRTYTEQLIYFVTGSPGGLMPADAHALMRMTCEQLYDKLAEVSGGKNLDDASRAHLLDVQRRLRKALDAEFQQY